MPLVLESIACLNRSIERALSLDDICAVTDIDGVEPHL
jgi:uncharacterized protein YerC